MTTAAAEKADALIAELNAVVPLPDAPQYDNMAPAALDRLDAIVQELSDTGQPERAASALFGIFERFPGCDGFGVFWSILHALENLPNGGTEMVASVRRVPNEWNLTMVNRFLNGGFATIDDTDLMKLLRQTAERPEISDEGRNLARHYLDYQAQKSNSLPPA